MVSRESEVLDLVEGGFKSVPKGSNWKNDDFEKVEIGVPSKEYLRQWCDSKGERGEIKRHKSRVQHRGSLG